MVASGSPANDPTRGELSGAAEGVEATPDRRSSGSVTGLPISGLRSCSEPSTDTATGLPRWRVPKGWLLDQWVGEAPTNPRWTTLTSSYRSSSVLARLR